MTVVKELNELAYKMTGVNPKAKTDQQALNYIEQHYQGGQPSPTPTSKFDYVIPLFYLDFVEELSTIEDTNVINVLNEISEEVKDELKPLRIGMFLHDLDTDDEYFLNANYRRNYENKLELFSSLGIYYEFHIFKSGTNWVVSIGRDS